MIAKRLRQLRLSHSLTLEALAAELGGMVTKQALSKYEQGRAQPSPAVLAKLVNVFGVKPVALFREPTIRVGFIAYRKEHSLTQTFKSKIESLIEHVLEVRVHLQELIGQADGSLIPIKQFRVQNIKDTENAAGSLRNQWKLGFDPISNVTGTLEENFISVVEVGAGGKFDGISAVAYDNHDVKAAAIVTRHWVPGEHQRFNIARELGHLVLDIPDNVDEQKAAFRFGAAFLVPRENLLQKVGSKRSFLQVEELLLLKKQFGISLHALLFRLKDLNVINESYYKHWCREINSLGWRKQEPFEFPPEESQWLRHNILRLLAEGLINLDDANAALGKAITFTQPLDVLERRAFRKLSLEKRRQLLTEQADKVVRHYKKDLEQYQEYRGRYY